MFSQIHVCGGATTLISSVAEPEGEVVDAEDPT